MTDGRLWTENVEQRRGSSRFPLDRADIERKFRGLAKSVLPPASVEGVIEQVDRLDEQDSMEPLAALLRGDRPRSAVAMPGIAARHTA